MGIKRVTKVEPPKKEVKPKAKPEPKKKEPTIVTPPVTEIKPTPIIETPKKDWYGISIIGKHPELNRFKGAVKMEGKNIGEVLLNIMKKYSDENNAPAVKTNQN